MRFQDGYGLGYRHGVLHGSINYYIFTSLNAILLPLNKTVDPISKAIMFTVYIEVEKTKVLYSITTTNRLIADKFITSPSARIKRNSSSILPKNSISKNIFSKSCRSLLRSGIILSSRQRNYIPTWK